MGLAQAVLQRWALHGQHQASAYCAGDNLIWVIRCLHTSASRAALGGEFDGNQVPGRVASGNANV